MVIESLFVVIADIIDNEGLIHLIHNDVYLYLFEII
jgi:hypothetical protein